MSARGPSNPGAAAPMSARDNSMPAPVHHHPQPVMQQSAPDARPRTQLEPLAPIVRPSAPATFAMDSPPSTRSTAPTFVMASPPSASHTAPAAVEETVASHTPAVAEPLSAPVPVAPALALAAPMQHLVTSASTASTAPPVPKRKKSQSKQQNVAVNLEK